MGKSSMFMHSHLLAVASVLAVVSNAALAENPNLGRIAAPEEVASWDISIGPDGAGLPPGSGTPKQGEAVYTAKCLVCHGEKEPASQTMRWSAGAGRSWAISRRSKQSEVSGPMPRRFSITCGERCRSMNRSL